MIVTGYEKEDTDVKASPLEGVVEAQVVTHLVQRNIKDTSIIHLITTMLGWVSSSMSFGHTFMTKIVVVSNILW